MMTTDEWVTAALADDAVVVELLFRLNQSSYSFASQQHKQQPPPPTLVLPFGWGHRQQRSKPAAAAAATRKERDSMRCSPTTPLSWSCGGSADASPSDGCDESSRPSDRSSGGRSKVTFTNDTTATTATNKRSRRKKTFAELKEEESLLLKEKTHLKKALASLHVTFKEQKARSENLKRLKLDRQLQSPNKTLAVSHDDPNAVNSGQFNLAEASAPDQIPVSPTTTTTQDNHPGADSFNVEKEVETTKRCFVLPDLNETPSEEDSKCETLHGLS